jgi:NTP pyrophosphatase (non-canonical NTP hydrolase)
MTIQEIMEKANANAKAKGFWDEPVRTFGDQIALMHSELSEALEEFRKFGLQPGMMCYRWRSQSPSGAGSFVEQVAVTMEKGDKGKPEGIAAEFADVIIRIADTCQQYGIPLQTAIELKMAYNKTRPHKHGGKII